MSASPTFNCARANEIENIFKRMGDLIRQIKDFREIKPLTAEFLNLTQEVKDFVASSNASSDEIKIHLAANLALNSKIRVQKIRLYQVVDNLIRNARDATSTEGMISIRVTATDNLVNLIVEDTGSGIPIEIRDKIFDVDFTTKPGKGTGLGLGIVKRICEECGASIEIESELGIGTKIIVSFPSAELMQEKVLLNHGEANV